MENEGKNTKLAAEFDLIADSYYSQHKQNIAITGEDPEYFSQYKVADLSAHVSRRGLQAGRILDFGSGIGNSIPYFRKFFPAAELTCADVSVRCTQISRERFPGEEVYAHIAESIPAPDESFDLVFTACVFHHIPHEEHMKWLSELRRVTRKGGVLAIYEHNPLNPLTVRAVNTCPFDANARLIRSGVMKSRVIEAGWKRPETRYKVFFPAALKHLRPLEKYLARVCLGAQWRLLAQK